MPICCNPNFIVGGAATGSAGGGEGRDWTAGGPASGPTPRRQAAHQGDGGEGDCALSSKHHSSHFFRSEHV